MARKPRDLAAGLFHVTCHSVWTSLLFRDDLDRFALLREIAAAVVDFGWKCLAYCVMTNHLHLILEVTEGTLAAGMKQINVRHACRFNARHRLRGHVYGGRYDARRLDTDAYLLAAFAYVANNPVEAGLCRSPVEWPWSSYAATVGLTEPMPWVDASRIVGYFGEPKEAAIARLRDYVEARHTVVMGSDPGLTPRMGGVTLP